MDSPINFLPPKMMEDAFSLRSNTLCQEKNDIFSFFY